jgi:hypothetical protein
MAFHLIRRRGVSEYVLGLNLALSALRVSWPKDDPDDIIFNIGDVRPVYEGISVYHGIFRELSFRINRMEVRHLLEQESQMMASNVRAGLQSDNAEPMKRKDMLEFDLLSADFKTDDGKTAPRIFYSVPLSDQKFETKEQELEFETTMILYDKDWETELAKVSETKKARVPKKGSKNVNMVGELILPEFEADRYNFAFQINESKTGKTALARGRYVVPYYEGQWVEASDLILADSIQEEGVKEGPFFHDGMQIIPNPSSIVKKDEKGYVYYEIYNLTKDSEGKVRYKVNLNLLTLGKKPGPLKKILSIGLGVTRMFFPYEMFLTDTAFFGIRAMRKNDKRGIVREEGIHEEVLEDDKKVVFFELDPSEYSKGIYQLYITIEDLNNKSITTRDVRLMID